MLANIYPISDVDISEHLSDTRKFAKIVSYSEEIFHRVLGGPRALCEIIPFPTTKRIGAIRRTAKHLSTLTKQKSRENILRNRLQTYANVLNKLGLPEDVVARETAAFESCVRQEVARSTAIVRSGKWTSWEGVYPGEQA
jgi:hypothetical protein